MLYLSLLFWILIFLLFYTYLGYPIILFGVSKIKKCPVLKGTNLPPVSIIIPVYNEGKIIKRKIENTLNLDYPEELLEIIVVSDASVDNTERIVAGFSDKGVKLITNPRRLGKTYGLNRAYLIASGEVLVFTDANSMFEGQTIRKLVRNFFDPEVGLVTGSTRYCSWSKDGGVIYSMNLYTQLETWIKRLESEVYSCVGADGAIFAMRNSLYHPLNDKDINDFVIPLDVVRQGYRVIYDPEVFCLEEHITDTSKEFWRQVRITNRTIWAILKNRDLLNPFRFKLFSWMLFSHKFLRFLFPIIFLFSLIFNLILIFYYWPLYLIPLSGFILLILLGVLSLKYDWTPLPILNSFFSLNVAIIFGWKKVFSKQVIIVWEDQEKD